MYKIIAIIIISTLTVVLYLWPDLHPERLVTNTHRWYHDLIMHGGYYFVASLILFSLRCNVSIFLLGSVFFIMSIALELLQYYSFNRSVDYFDIICNFCGILLATGIFQLFSKNKKQ